jgi:hypothetical protein
MTTSFTWARLSFAHSQLPVDGNWHDEKICGCRLQQSY